MYMYVDEDQICFFFHKNHITCKYILYHMGFFFIIGS